MLSVFKHVVTFFVLASFLAIVLFSFAMMTHGEDGSMIGDCPFSAFGGASLCPQDMLSLMKHYASVYYSFLNVPLHVDITTLVIAFLLVVSALFAAFIYSQVFLLSFVQGQVYDVLYDVSSSGKKITRWLSLLQHSPSVT